MTKILWLLYVLQKCFSYMNFTYKIFYQIPRKLVHLSFWLLQRYIVFCIVFQNSKYYCCLKIDTFSGLMSTIQLSKKTSQDTKIPIVIVCALNSWLSDCSLLLPFKSDLSLSMFITVIHEYKRISKLEFFQKQWLRIGEDLTGVSLLWELFLFLWSMGKNHYYLSVNCNMCYMNQVPLSRREEKCNTSI